jgi:hypothetical protein
MNEELQQQEAPDRDHPGRSTACPTPQLDSPSIVELPSTAPAGALIHHNASLTAPDTTALQLDRKRNRNGKIARLTKDLREMVNRLLRNNAPYSRIVKALKSYEIVVTERNISNWKVCGGYREWCLAEEHAIELRLHQDNLVNLLRKDSASHVPEVGLQVAATRLSEFFLTPEAAQLLASNPDEYHRRAATLARLTAEIHKLQKYRDDCARALGPKHDPEKIRHNNEEEFEQATKYYSSTVPKDIREPTIPHRNYIPKS